MYTWNDGTYLAHHGIKGQRWGVRRFQNTDGSYTEEGLRRRSKESNKRSGLSDRQKTAIKIGAAAVATALVAYGAYSLYKGGYINPKSYGAAMYPRDAKLSTTLSDYSDNSVTLKPGTVLQRVSRSSVEDYSKKGEAYVSYMFRDNMGYKYGLPREAIWRQDDAYAHKLVSDKEIKAPSSRELASIYLSLFPKASDMNFRYDVQQGFIAKDDNYDPNDPIARITMKNVSKLKDELSKRGYNAIIDLEDASKKGSIAPLIIFDPGSNLHFSGSHKITPAETIVAKILR